MGKLPMKLKNRDRLFKKFEESKLYIDKNIYNAARYKLQKMIINKKEHFLKTNQLNLLVNLKIPRVA